MNAEKYGMLKVRASMAAYFAEQLERDLATLPLNISKVREMYDLTLNAQMSMEKVQRLLRDNWSRMITPKLGDMVK